MEIGDIVTIAAFLNFASLWRGNRGEAVNLRINRIGDVRRDDLLMILGFHVTNRIGAPPVQEALTLSKHGLGWIDVMNLKGNK